ncbi:hypothetical protein DM02DRAFT_659566 [Periconia macrospinosa]|uniref:Uncharacterized protein n=1 Tax=Periconia macrospinosa TaxID=97972 RepID=A0A2V1DEQ1_9PLEO|nr:hypothetical protein DM02DRAFT_659566 [Periconia macrospinosa]
MHLDALDKLCFKAMASHPFCDWSPFAQSALEVAGILDIPTSILGRQRGCLHLWRRLRDSQSYSERGLLAGVEPVSGLPRSLLDIFARIEEPQAALRFLQWPGELGSLLVCHLWEAYRIAGALVAISMRAETHARDTPSASGVPPAANLVNRLLASIAAVLATGDDNIEHEKIMGTNILLYPIVTAATQRSVLEENSKWTEVVRGHFRQCAGSKYSPRVELCWTLVEKLWQREDNICIHELARQEGLEIGLF